MSGLTAHLLSLAASLSWSSLLALLAITLLLVWLYQKVWLPFVVRLPGEPPLLSGAVPWWGCAGDFGASPCSFVREMQKKHGSAYTVVAAGTRVLMLCDYRHIKTFFRQSKTLSATELKVKMAVRIFGERVATAERALEEETRAAYTKFLAGDALDELSSSYQDVLRDMLLLPTVKDCTVARNNPHDIESEFEIGPSNTEWQTLDLVNFVARTGYASAVDTLFGDGAYSPEAFDDYQKFDESVLLMLGGLPSWLPSISDSLRARDRLIRHLSQKHKNMSALMAHRRELFTTSSGVDADDLKDYNFGFLFGLVANTSPAQFWTLLLLLKHPVVLGQIKAELRDALGEGWTEKASKRHLAHDPQKLRQQLNSMIKLESVINEMFRTCSAPLVGRIALEDTTIELPEGPIKVRKGDRVCLVTHTVHNDHAIYGKNTSEFQWDRYLSEDHSGMRKFTCPDTGRSIPHYLLPFGGGNSMCPGRHFAKDEIKIYVATLLACFDIEEVEENQPPPGFDFARSTIGVIPPSRSDTFPVRLRRQPDV